MKEADGKTKQNKTNKQLLPLGFQMTCWRRISGRWAYPLFPVLFCTECTIPSFYFWRKKKDFMKQDKITYDYMKHNCDKSQNYTY